MKKEKLQEYVSIVFNRKDREYKDFLLNIFKELYPIEYEQAVVGEKYTDNQAFLIDANKLKHFFMECIKKLGLSINKEYVENLTEKRQNFRNKKTDKDSISDIDEIIDNEMPELSDEKKMLIKERFLELYKQNNSIAQNINIRLLTDEYYYLFDYDKILRIGAFPVIQDAIINLTPNELFILKKCFDNYLIKEKLIIDSETNLDSEWESALQTYLAIIYSGNYSELITEIGLINDENEKEECIELLSTIINEPNFFNIRTINELKKFESIKKEICLKIISGQSLTEYNLISNMTELEKYRFAILQHYGMTSCMEIIEKFNSINYDEICQDDFTLSSTLYSLKMIYSINSEELMKKIAIDMKDEPYITQEEASYRLIEKRLKCYLQEYYNKELTDINELPLLTDEMKKKYGLNYFQGKILNATDSDFRLVVTSVSPYSDEYNAEILDYYEFLNRPNLKSTFSCYSTISRKNLAVADIPHTLLGYNKISGLYYSAPFDSNSISTTFVPKADSIYFLTLNDMDQYQSITEINSARINPDYIPIIKRNGVLVNYDEAEQAAYDFSEHLNKPESIMVFIDYDKIEYEQIKESIKLINRFQQTQDKQLLRQIAIDMMFCGEPHNIYEYIDSTVDITMECLGKNSEKFGELLLLLDLDELTNKLNSLQYSKENNLNVSLSQILDDNTSFRPFKTGYSLERIAKGTQKISLKDFISYKKEEK